MSEAEFERRQTVVTTAGGSQSGEVLDASELAIEPEPSPPRISPTPSLATARGRGSRTKPSKPRRVQRMFALEEELDKKLWLYAIHVGKDRSDVVNDLLRPVVASMVLYDSRDRRSVRASDPSPDIEQPPG